MQHQSFLHVSLSVASSRDNDPLLCCCTCSLPLRQHRHRHAERCSALPRQCVAVRSSPRSVSQKAMPTTMIVSYMLQNFFSSSCFIGSFTSDAAVVRITCVCFFIFGRGVRPREAHFCGHVPILQCIGNSTVPSLECHLNSCWA